jgi:hypothetical protein
MNASYSASQTTTIRIIPWFFILTGLGILLVSGWALARAPLTAVWLAAVLILLSVLLLFAEYVSLTLDQNRGLAILTRRRVWRVTRREIPFDEVQTVAVDQSRSSDGSGPTYRALIVLKSGERVPVTNHWSSGRRRTQKLVQQISDHMSQSRLTPIDPALDGIVQVTKDGETAGIPWKIELFSANDNTPVTRWFTIEDRLRNGFLMLIPAASGAKPTAMPTGGLAGAAARFMYRHYLKMLYLRPEDLPGLDQAVTLPNSDRQLAAHYTAVTSTPADAAAWLNATASALLIDWQQRNPLHTGAGAGMPYVVITPQGLWLIFFNNAYQDEKLAEIAGLGAALVRAQRG